MIDEVELKIQKLQDGSHLMKEQAKKRLMSRVDVLTKKKEILEHSLHEIKESSTEKWKHLRNTAEEKIGEIEEETKSLFHGLKGGFTHLFSKFRKGN